MDVRTIQSASLMKILKYGRYLGIFPFTIHPSKNGYILKYSSKSIAWSFVIVLLLFIVGFFGIPNQATNFIIKLAITANALTVSLCIISLSSKKSKLELFINHLAKVDYKLGVVTEKRRGIKLLLEIYIAGFIFMSILIFTDLIIICPKSKFWHNFHVLIVCCLTFSFNAAMLLSYRSFIDHIRSRVLLLRKYLNSTFFENVQSKRDISCEYSRRCTEIYLNISEAAEILNKTYGLTILISILVCLLNFIVSPYVIYYQIVEERESCCVTASMGWLLGHVIKVLMIVEPCHSCSIQGKKLAQQLCKMSSKVTKLSNYLKRFYRLVDDYPIIFHMCGIKIIDRSLLQAVMAGVTTYLVIVFQVKDQF